MSILRKYKTKTVMRKSIKSKIAIHDNHGNTYKLMQNGTMESIDLTGFDHILNDVKVFDPVNRQWINTDEKTIEKSVIRVIPIKSIKDLRITTIDHPQYEYSMSQKLSYVDIVNGQFEISNIPHGIFDFKYQPIKHREHKKKKITLKPSCVTKMDDGKYQDFITERSMMSMDKPKIYLIEHKPYAKIDKPKPLNPLEKWISYNKNKIYLDSFIGKSTGYKPKTHLEKWRHYWYIKKSGNLTFVTGIPKSLNLPVVNNNRLDIKPFMLYVRRLQYLGY